VKLFTRLMNAQQGDAGDGGIASSPSDEMRATLEKAFEAAEPAPPTDRTTPTEKRTTDRTEPDGKPRAGETPAQTAERVRDERGRFAAAEAVTRTAAEAEKQAAGVPDPNAQQQEKPPGEQQQALAAPRSWKPGAREHWNSLPPDVQQEVLRRENEVYRFAQGTAQARQVADQLGQMAQAYAPALQAEGVDIVTATNNLMGMVARLRFGTAQERASTIVSLVQNYGVDIEALDQALVNSMGGQDGQPVQGQPQQFVDPRVDQLLGAIQQAQYQRVEQVRNEAAREVQTFGQGKDFFDDVREDMADILELAARRGIDMSMEQAYERACRMNPEIDRVIAQRKAAAEAGQNSQGSIARARLASSSVRSTPAVPPGKTGDQPKNLRDELEESWGAAAQRGR
jgi:hypothetical protein